MYDDKSRIPGHLIKELERVEDALAERSRRSTRLAKLWWLATFVAIASLAVTMAAIAYLIRG